MKCSIEESHKLVTTKQIFHLRDKSYACFVCMYTIYI